MCLYFMSWAIAVLGQSKLAAVVMFLTSFRQVRDVMLAGSPYILTEGCPCLYSSLLDICEIFLASFFSSVVLKWKPLKCSKVELFIWEASDPVLSKYPGSRCCVFSHPHTPSCVRFHFDCFLCHYPELFDRLTSIYLLKIELSRALLLGTCFSIHVLFFFK